MISFKSNKVYISYSGIKEVDDLFKEMPKVVSHRVLGAAHVAAAKPLINAAYFGVQLKSGRLAQSIGAIKLPLRKTKELGAVVVGPIRQKGKRYGHHGHLVEYGHRMISHKVSGKKQIEGPRTPDGRVRPFPFMRPAFEKTKQLVEQNIKIEIVNKLLSVMKRTIKKSGKEWSNG